MKKCFSTCTFLLLIAVLAALISACGFVEVKDVPLHFVIDGAAYRDMTVGSFAAGGLNVGEKDGYYFDGWYLDTTYTQKARPASLEQETTLYGRWQKERGEGKLYVITFVAEGVVVGKQEVAALADIRYPAAPEVEGKVFSDWSGKPAVLTEDCVLTAVYRLLYTVDFVDEDGTLLLRQRIADGGFATPPVPPVKAGDAQYTYEFAGWYADEGDYDEVHSDMVVYATFDTIINRYTYTLHKQNGERDDERSVNYGTQITLPTPTKQPTVDTTYAFAGWDSDNDGEVDVTQNKFRLYADFEAWAVYTSAPRAYRVVFDVDGDKTGVDVLYGQSAVYPLSQAPARSATAQYTYAFAGWDTDADGVADGGLAFVDADIDAVAVFDAEVNWYTYAFLDADGVVLGEACYAPYGTVIEPPAEPPVKASTASYDFAFSEWDGYQEGMTLVEDVTFTPTFSMNVRLYTISFKYRNRTLAEYRVPYGTVIDYDERVKPCPYPVEDEAYAYCWNNWTENYVVTKDFTFTLDRFSQYDYVVTWQIGEDEQLLAYYREGDYLALPAEPTREGYAFAGWQGYVAGTTVCEDMTLAALWEAETGASED